MEGSLIGAEALLGVHSDSRTYFVVLMLFSLLVVNFATLFLEPFETDCKVTVIKLIITSIIVLVIS